MGFVHVSCRYNMAKPESLGRPAGLGLGARIWSFHGGAYCRGQLILNGVVAVGHNDDTDSDSATWIEVGLSRRSDAAR